MFKRIKKNENENYLFLNVDRFVLSLFFEEIDKRERWQFEIEKLIFKF